MQTLFFTYHIIILFTPVLQLPFAQNTRPCIFSCLTPAAQLLFSTS